MGEVPYEIIQKHKRMEGRVGWFWTFFYIFNKSTPGICYIPSKSTENSKTIFLPSKRFIIGQDFLGRAQYSKRVQNLLFTIWASWVSKDAEFYIGFKNINLP
jgi:hypothetical protein